MAVIVETLVTGAAGVPLTATTLTASDTLTFREGAGQTLLMHNGTAGSLTVVLNDSDVTSVPVEGVGSVSVSAGISVVLAAGARAAVLLDNSRRRWRGVISVTGGTGISAVLTAAS